jgi:hypothetical protein
VCFACSLCKQGVLLEAAAVQHDPCSTSQRTIVVTSASPVLTLGKACFSRKLLGLEASHLPHSGPSPAPAGSWLVRCAPAANECPMTTTEHTWQQAYWPQSQRHCVMHLEAETCGSHQTTL